MATTAKRLEPDLELETLVASLRDYAIFMLDADGRVRSWNEGARAIKGYSAHEIIGQSFERFYTPEDVGAGKPKTLLARAVAEGRVRDEGWRVRKDGTRFWAEVVITAAFRKSGALLGFIKVTRDLSERREAEQALKASERNLAEQAKRQGALAELGIYALQTTDVDAVLERAVRLATQTLGAAVAEVLEHIGDGRFVVRAHVGLRGVDGKPLEPANRPQSLHTLSTNKPVIVVDWASETRFPYPVVAEPRPIVGGVTVVISSGHEQAPFGVFGVHTAAVAPFTEDDVHFVQSIANVVASAVARRRAEELVVTAQYEVLAERSKSARAAEAVRARDEFISVTAHELRTPLTALHLKLQGLDLVLKRDLGELCDMGNVRTRVAGAMRQTTRLSNLVERLLEVSRLVDGQVSVQLFECDASALLTDVVNQYRDQAAHAGSELELVTCDDACGLWDPALLRQVFSNLISNAVKYGAGRPIAIECSAANGEVRLTIADHGIGIPPDDMPRLFERFQRAAPIQNYGGLGLGLYLSRHFVEAMGGHIRVTSERGSGTLFEITLPKRPVLTSEAPPEQTKEAS